jgi:hypothetical protein
LVKSRNQILQNFTHNWYKTMMNSRKWIKWWIYNKQLGRKIVTPAINIVLNLLDRGVLGTLSFQH